MKSMKLARPNFSFYWQSSGCPGSDLNFPRSNIRFSTFCPQKSQRILSPFQGISSPCFAQVRVGVCALYQPYTHGRLRTSHKRSRALCTHGCHWRPLCPTIPEVLSEGYIPQACTIHVFVRNDVPKWWPAIGPHLWRGSQSPQDDYLGSDPNYAIYKLFVFGWTNSP